MTPEYINTHEPIYSYLLRYFLPEFSDPYFQQNAAQEIKQDERMTYCRYMAAWLPHEQHYLRIYEQCRHLDMTSTTRLWTGGASLKSQVLSPNLRKQRTAQIITAKGILS